jgi:hypothetical protein
MEAWRDKQEAYIMRSMKVVIDDFTLRVLLETQGNFFMSQAESGMGRKNVMKS